MTKTTVRGRRWMPRPLRVLRNRWFGSLQLRVVASTVVVSLIVVILTGTLLVSRIRTGLLETKVKNSVAEATSGVRSAQQLADSSDLTQQAGAGQLIDQISTEVSNRAGSPPLYDVLLLANPGSGTTTVPERRSGAIEEASIPEQLRIAVEQQKALAYSYTKIRYADGSSGPGLAVGAPLVIPNLGTYELFYVYSTQSEQRTLDLVQSSSAFAGIILVILLAFIIGFVTRLVLKPVRIAADVAERLAAGRLEERMRVRGEDELARLATAFNSMAGNIKQQIRQLEALSRIQRRFVADVSHELRTPLTTIRMASDLIYENKDELDPATSRSAELLTEQLDRFEELFTELLEISRFDSGQAILDAEGVDLRMLAERVINAAAPLAQAKGSVVSFNQPDQPCLADMDAVRIERVIRNLVVNAIEHGDGKPIVVTIGADDQAVAVSVRDHGVGLRPGEASLVFNRFWRSDPSRARTIGGSGLGLSIALEDARLHGGWLEAWGQPARGAVFRLTLPRKVGTVLQGSPVELEPAVRAVTSEEKSS